MNYCDAMNAYATNLDWICNGVLFLLGAWKLWDLLEMFGRWVIKRL